jgi:hypothetical protein
MYKEQNQSNTTTAIETVFKAIEQYGSNRLFLLRIKIAFSHYLAPGFSASKLCCCTMREFQRIVKIGSKIKFVFFSRSKFSVVSQSVVI